MQQHHCSPALPFQSTPSGGKATCGFMVRICTIAFQSTPSGGKATAQRGRIVARAGVSIHAFRGEGDSSRTSVLFARRVFQSTPSGGKATSGGAAGVTTLHSFNPRLPGGRRPGYGSTSHSISCFNPRLPGGRRLKTARGQRNRRGVSIHAFRGEGDNIRASGKNCR